MAAAEIVSIGTELLLGQILNSNSTFLSRELAALGINCYRHTTVGDNKSRIKECLHSAFQTSEIVITTGGLGPTADDLTTECIAELFGAEMFEDPEIVKWLEKIFKGFGRVMPGSNLKQALRPRGAQILPNPVGSAPGIIWELQGALLEKAGICEPNKKRVILTFPGVPSEMEKMWKETAGDYLARTFSSGTIFSIELKHYGIGESALAEKYAHLLDLENPTVAPLAGTGECRLRVTARAGTHEQAQALAMPVADEIRKRSGVLCYGTDEDTLESAVGGILAERGMTVAFAESCTGGLASKRLTDIPGSSRYTRLNVVAYSNEAKMDVLGVHKYILETRGAVSAECAQAMAAGIRQAAKSDVGVSITGVAGPDGGTPEKPVGLVYLGITANHFHATRKLNLPSTMTRDQIRYHAASEALNLVRLYLLEMSGLC